MGGVWRWLAVRVRGGVLDAKGTWRGEARGVATWRGEQRGVLVGDGKGVSRVAGKGTKLPLPLLPEGRCRGRGGTRDRDCERTLVGLEWSP